MCLRVVNLKKEFQEVYHNKMGLFKVTGGVATPFLQTEEYWFKNNGKTITQKEYCKIQSEIGNDETKGAGLQTSHPDACGLKAKRDKDREDNQRKPK